MQRSRFRISSRCKWLTKIINNYIMEELVVLFRTAIKQISQLDLLRYRLEIFKRTWLKSSSTRFTTINSFRIQTSHQDSKMVKELHSHNRFKGRVTKVAREVREVKVSSNRIRSRGTFSWTKMMSWVTHQECIFQCSIMKLATAKEEVIILMMEKKWMVIIKDTGLNIATQATNELQRTKMMDQTVIMEH